MWEDPRVGTRPTDAANSSVLVVGDFLYVCTSNGVDQWPSDTKPLVVPAPLAPSLIVLHKNTGRLVAVDDERIGTRLLHGQWSSPSAGRVGDKTLVFFGGGDGLCYAFEALAEEPKELAKLKKVWSFDCIPPHYRVYENGKLLDYRCGDKRNPMSRNKNDGTFVGTSEIVGTPVFHDHRVYVAIGRDPHHGRGRGNLVCIDATKTGDITQTGEIWSYDEIERTISTVAIVDGLLYIADLPGRIHCLDADTGGCHWVYETGSEAWGSTLLADGKIYLGTQKYLFVLAADKQPKLLAKIRLGAPMDTSPVAANGVLYVAAHRYLWAVQKRNGQ
jgi:outer membrane protein assembly factor BamB